MDVQTAFWLNSPTEFCNVILMSSQSLNEILIKIPTELFNFIFPAYRIIYVLFYRESFVYICMRRDDVRRIQQRYFIYRSIFLTSEFAQKMCPRSLRSLPF